MCPPLLHALVIRETHPQLARRCGTAIATAASSDGSTWSFNGEEVCMLCLCLWVALTGELAHAFLGVRSVCIEKTTPLCMMLSCDSLCLMLFLRLTLCGVIPVIHFVWCYSCALASHTLNHSPFGPWIWNNRCSLYSRRQRIGLDEAIASR
jgi:hypothetical protein